MAKMELDYSYSQDRELSWLLFNERVLDEAGDFTVPLLERLHFIAIYISNLNEFFMVRVGSIYDLLETDAKHLDVRSNMTPQMQLTSIFREVHRLYHKKDELYSKCQQELELRNIYQVDINNLNKKDLKFIETYFEEFILPMLSPMVVDVLHPFPHIENDELYVTVPLFQEQRWMLGLIPISKHFKKLVWLSEKTYRYVLLEDVIRYFVNRIFLNYETNSPAIIKLTRSADIDIREEFEESGAKDFRQTMKDMIKKRKRLRVVRLEVNGQLHKAIKEILLKYLEITDDNIFESKSPMNFSFIKEIEQHIDAELLSNLSYPKFTPARASMFNDNDSITKQVERNDKLLFLPYESMDPFIKLIKESANDKHTVSIKITIYRLAKNTKLVKYLVEAAENGIDVFVLMELRARFDEENNINYSQLLEEAGCKVVYGFEDYKVHSKICLITKRTGTKVSYITQIGTGNYNESTARVYTDLSLITTDLQISEDARDFFMNMAISNLNGEYKELLVAPVSLRQKILQYIKEQTRFANEGKSAYIFMKMNSLTDRKIIDALAKASQAGVKIDLIIRGICCIIPGIHGKTDNIRVISIVGRFLEHSRIYVFGRSQGCRMYISSADMMTRNTKRRVEVAAPIKDKKIKEKIFKMIDIMLKDNVKASVLKEDRNYYKDSTKTIKVNSQEYFMEEAKKPVIQSVEKTSLFKRIFHK